MSKRILSLNTNFGSIPEIELKYRGKMDDFIRGVEFKRTYFVVCLEVFKWSFSGSRLTDLVDSIETELYGKLYHILRSGYYLGLRKRFDCDLRYSHLKIRGRKLFYYFRYRGLSSDEIKKLQEEANEEYSDSYLESNFRDESYVSSGVVDRVDAFDHGLRVVLFKDGWDYSGGNFSQMSRLICKEIVDKKRLIKRDRRVLLLVHGIDDLRLELVHYRLGDRQIFLDYSFSDEISDESVLELQDRCKHYFQ